MISMIHAIPLMTALLVFAAIAPAQQAKRNVLLIVSDDLNNSLGCYGAPVKTPNLDRLAARGVRFDRAYCQYPLCGPSRASLMSGMRPDAIGVVTNGPTVRANVKDVVTLPQLFREQGYFAARVGKIYHLGIPGGVGTPGPDDPLSWDHTFNPKGAEFATEGEEHWPDRKDGQGFRYVIGKGDGREQHDYQAADEAIRLLNENKDKPFFLAVGFIRPHVPLIAPQRDFERYPLERITLLDVPAEDREDIPALAFFQPNRIDRGMTPQQCRESIRAYYAAISFMDSQLGRVIDELEKLGLADNTVITFVGDHGYLLGEHREWQKMTLFEPVARVPMLIAAPGVEAGATRSIVEMIDLYPTIASLCGLTPPPTVQGASLRPILGDKRATVKRAAYTQVRRKTGEGRSVRTDRWRYTEWKANPDAKDPAITDGAELYDHQSDPGELKNLAADPAHAQTIAEMKKLLAP
jgi:uncharacterized sulfatase